ncbi:MAG: dual OB domain-containing protein [Blastocatellia bacterium]
MTVTKELTILALTKMHGGVCTAGVDGDGRWVRPVRPPTESKPRYEAVTDYCLLPLDFFHGGMSHLVNLGVTRFWFSAHMPQPPHTEDWTMELTRKPQLIRKLADEEQEKFLAAHVEDGLPLFDDNGRRSLALIKPDSFSFSFGMNQSGDGVSARASFKVGDVEVGDVGCTDLRMRALGRKLLEKSGGERSLLSDEDFRRRDKQATYLSIGLSRPFQGKHWLILVGVHSIPELTVEIDFAKL